MPGWDYGSGTEFGLVQSPGLETTLALPMQMHLESTSGSGVAFNCCRRWVQVAGGNDFILILK